MTRTERKKEDKEQEGDPMMRSRRMEIARSNAQTSTGPKQATFAVQHGAIIVAFRWVEGETRVPIVVAKSTTSQGTRSIKKMIPRRAPVLRDGLAAQLVSTQIGADARQKDIHQLAALMSKNGLY